MDIPNPELARVVFDFPREHLAELTGSLADLAARHNFSVTFCDTEATEPSLTVGTDQKEYNPELVEDVKIDDGTSVKVVTREKLKDFEVSLGWSKGKAERAVKALVWASQPERSSVITHDAELSNFLVWPETGICAGFKADMFEDLVKHIHRMGSHSYYDFGPRALELFAKAQEALFLNPSEQT